MHPPSVLHLWLGVADLGIAIGMASMSLLFPGSGCAGLGALLCLAASVPVGLTAVWLLVHPRSASWIAILMGIGALIIAALIVAEGPSDADSPVGWLLVLAGIVQLPIGLCVRRAVRAVRTVAMTGG